jgi:hypothetical protein
MQLLIQLLPLIVLLLFFAVPFALLFRRMGHSPWWALLGLIPLVLLALPWMAALMSWKEGPSR